MHSIFGIDVPKEEYERYCQAVKRRKWEKEANEIAERRVKKYRRKGLHGYMVEFRISEKWWDSYIPEVKVSYAYAYLPSWRLKTLERKVFRMKRNNRCRTNMWI